MLQSRFLTSPCVGKVGKDSAAAKFASATPSDGFSIQAEKPYAEVRNYLSEHLLSQITLFLQLWMGTHPSLPSKDLETKRSLLELVQDNQALMTPKIGERYGGKLPFLFKVLSINKALSIQAHPNKKLAEKLHSKDPKNYPGMYYFNQPHLGYLANLNAKTITISLR